MNDQSNYAVLTARYQDQIISSIPLELVKDSDNLRMVMEISESGTNHLTMLKIPISETKFIVFSKEQLRETLFEIEIIPSNKIISDNV